VKPPDHAVPRNHWEEPLLNDAGRLAEPVDLVDLDTDTPDTAPGDRIRLGVSSRRLGEQELVRAAGLDVTVVPIGCGDEPWLAAAADPRAAVDALHAAALANPQASVTLAQVLRVTGLDLAAALQLESFAYSTLLGGREFAQWLDHRGPRPLPPPPPHQPVMLQRNGNRLDITLNRPERRNAYGREVRDALVEALRLAVLDDSVTQVVLDGAGPCFSAGGDLDEFGTTPDLATAHFVRTAGGAARLLHQLADRLEARVHGTCVGAGIELPAFAGRVTAAAGTVFRLPEIGMGLIPGAGGTVSIPRRIGRWRTLYFALSGELLDAETALRWGLIDDIE